VRAIGAKLSLQRCEAGGRHPGGNVLLPGLPEKRGLRVERGVAPRPDDRKAGARCDQSGQQEQSDEAKGSHGFEM
jgi:hypothetical protein